MFIWLNNSKYFVSFSHLLDEIMLTLFEKGFISRLREWGLLHPVPFFRKEACMQVKRRKIEAPSSCLNQFSVERRTCKRKDVLLSPPHLYVVVMWILSQQWSSSETMPVFELVDSVPYTPKRRPASPVYADPLGQEGAGKGVRILDTYQSVLDCRQPFEIYQACFL